MDQTTIRCGRLALLTAIGLALLAEPVIGQTVAQRKPTLEKRLVTGLRVRRPSEYRYIDAVVDSVNRGDLPEKIVNRMFFWARSRAPGGDEGRRPIVYFQAGLDRVAAKLKISIRQDEPSPGAGSGS